MASEHSATSQAPGWLTALRVYFEPKVLYVALLGFSSGLPLALTGGTLQGWMNRAGVDLGTIGLIALVGLPYSLKFIWAPLIDAVRLPGLTRLLGRRRGWLVASQVLLALVLLILSRLDPASAPFVLAVVALVVAFVSATQDILVDTLRVEALDDRQQAAGVANYVAAYRIALLLTTSGALFVAGTLTDMGFSINGAYGTVYIGAAALMSIGLLGAILMPEPKEDEDAPTLSGLPLLLFGAGVAAAIAALFWWRSVLPPEHARYFVFYVLGAMALFAGLVGLAVRRHSAAQAQGAEGQLRRVFVEPFEGFMRDHPLWAGLLLLVILFKLGDAFAGALFTPFAQRLGFEDQVIGIAVGWGIIATIVGGFLGAYVLRWLGLLTALWVATVVQIASNLGYLALAMIGDNTPALFIAVLTEHLTGGVGTTIYIALLSALCLDRKFTATQFALLTALSAVPRTFFVAPTGWIAAALGWPMFFVVSIIAAIPGVAVLWWLGQRGAIPADKPKSGAESEA